MKRILLSLTILSLIILPSSVLAQNQIDVWVFGTATCPFCQELKEHIAQLIKNDSLVNFSYFELTGISNQDYRDNLDTLKKIYNATDYTGVPITFIGDRVIRGAQFDEVDSAIEYCKENGCESPAQKLANAGNIVETENQQQPVGQKEQTVGWVVLAIFLLVVAIFGVKIIKDRR